MDSLEQPNGDLTGDDAPAVAAGCALLATAGDADASTLRGRLQAMLPADALRAFDDHARHIQDNATAGEADAMGVARQAKGDVNGAKRVFSACLNAAGGIDALSPAQATKARSLCESLNLSPTQFGL
ncbi:tellurite resistance TerB family protein [Azospirillum rugosum]|uniref:Tellurite resistance protein n=1 Tax=Azospirillum rugosum TaxID=416170 RepID=A0ABS4SNV6_9PROT|nr:tellurite resistance TerB family protein [Azospirillum rugosum]MBP2294241.1 tellurite resistance protein [Azospirillum rugosum]MDQ0527370.1 tellurite resistance protein [Azospirillum rugosum]